MEPRSNFISDWVNYLWEINYVCNKIFQATAFNFSNDIEDDDVCAFELRGSKMQLAKGIRRRPLPP